MTKLLNQKFRTPSEFVLIENTIKYQLQCSNEHIKDILVLLNCFVIYPFIDDGLNAPIINMGRSIVIPLLIEHSFYYNKKSELATVHLLRQFKQSIYLELAFFIKKATDKEVINHWFQGRQSLYNLDGLDYARYTAFEALTARAYDTLEDKQEILLFCNTLSQDPNIMIKNSLRKAIMQLK